MPAKTFAADDLPWYEYATFLTMLAFSAFIGIYYGCFGSKQATPKEYLLGGKKMKIFPIAVSVALSQFSGITLVGVPADVYTYGAGIWLMCFSLVLVAISTIYIYLPVFYNLELTSTYEYLERRFDRKTRLFATVMYLLASNCYLAVVVYSPALAIATATGINVHLVSFIVCAVGIFYTTIGGLVTVVWTDMLQFIVIIGSLVSTCAISFGTLGGFSAVWNKAVDGGRLDIFDLDFNPTRRDTLWIILIGYTVQVFGQVGIHPTGVQKFIALPSFRASAWSVVYYVLTMCVVMTFCNFIGFGMTAKYSECDPLLTKQITRYDQLVPYYIKDIAAEIPGVFGLYVAAVFSATLSTISSSLNALSGVIYKDFVSNRLRSHVSEKSVTKILKLIVVADGIIFMLIVFLIKYLQGGIFGIAIALTSITHGPLIGLFSLGMIFPKANSKGAFYGAIVGLASIAAIALPSQYYTSTKLFKYPTKSISTDGCEKLNQTVAIISTMMTRNFTTPSYESTTSGVTTFEPHFLFRISFYNYTLIGALVTIISGLMISYATNKGQPGVNKILISPMCQFLLPKEDRIGCTSGEATVRMLEIKLEEKENN
ncbi:sodium-coupled monocarboxylate transporter 2-like isoform X1 [Tenebrio molitor]|uniref:sodium-coupled monocarboxylate transporter 2-like isoform X1 n=1 Tax=Tenebrio molitor TaxID=7067 RepID=UPI003624AAC6